MIDLVRRRVQQACNNAKAEDAGPRDERGFTLIELMVVVLIIAILLAIAIPTFLGSRNTANARSMQSNLRNALTAEQTQWTNTQSFSATTGTTGMGAIEPSLNWVTGTTATEGGNTVSVTLFGGTGGIGANQQVVLQGYAKDGNCYDIFQSDDPTLSMTAYDETKGPCSVPVLANIPTAVATAPGNGVIGPLNTSYSWNTSW
jgi:type IV pilus assembly protein PilA